ncbi:hypothetical protein [Lunatibacter salilacus]|uniref:hypothetical protein n=1 Tax=Lunatibacter salilacus TaxID=2483804 RepID=UPI00131CED41|nr:hypothetical protein [Lunatibacter salilacus]
MSQDIYVGARVGGFITDWENSGSLAVLQSRSTRLWNYNLYARQEILEHLYIGMEAGFSRSTAELNVFQPERKIAKGNGPTLAFWSIVPTIRKDFPLSDSRFGFQASLSVPVNYTSFDNYEYAGDEFGGVIRVGDKLPITDIYIYGNESVSRRFSVFLRPEVGVFYKLNSRGRISVDIMWGINPSSPLVTRNFHEVVYEGETFDASLHKYHGQYLAYTIGYEYRIFK